VLFTNRKNAPLLFSTRTGTPPFGVALSGALNFGSLELTRREAARVQMVVGRPGHHAVAVKLDL